MECRRPILPAGSLFYPCGHRRTSGFGESDQSGYTEINSMMRPSIIQLTYMKRYLVLVTLLTMLLGVGACKKKKRENPMPVYPATSWSSAGTEKYPFHLTERSEKRP